jgi:hypothetical protein
MTYTTQEAAGRLIELAKAAPAGPYTLDASDRPWAHEAFVRAPSWGVVARTGLGPSLPHWDGPQRAVAALFAACDPQTITSICTALQEAHAELDALRAERDALRVKAEAGAQVMRNVFYPGVKASKEGA